MTGYGGWLTVKTQYWFWVLIVLMPSAQAKLIPGNLRPEHVRDVHATRPNAHVRDVHATRPNAHVRDVHATRPNAKATNYKALPQPISCLKADTNTTYLNGIQPPPREETMHEILFDKSVSTEMSSRYNSFYENYEKKKRYRLDRLEDYYSYHQANKSLMEWTMKKLVEFHAQHSIKRADQNAPAVKTVTKAVETVQAIQNTSVAVSEGTNVNFKYDFPSGFANAEMTSPYVNSTVNYYVQPITLSDNSAPADKIALALTRSFDEVQASTGLRYGVNQKVLNYGAQKQIVGPVSAQVDQYRYLRDSSRNETVYRLNFGTSF